MAVTISPPVHSAITGAIAEAYEREQQLDQDYRGLVRDLAGSKTVTPKAVSAILSATGRTAAQLQADVELLQKRRQAAADIADGTEAERKLVDVTNREGAATARHVARVAESVATRDRELVALAKEASPLRSAKQRAEQARLDLVGRLLPADLRKQIADAEEELRRFNTSPGNSTSWKPEGERCLGVNVPSGRAEIEGRLDALRRQAFDVE